MTWIKHNIDWVAFFGALGGCIFYASVTYSDVQNLKNEVYGTSPSNSIRSCMARSEQKLDDVAQDVKDIKNCINYGNCK